ncbi:anthrone oxygenase family protein [Leifsonia sp. Leaf264]|uniref:anthrone oxygenase family protein n=1 Tax=Leifsonia sp. Leaf264 TaxID=1736314 RepID=UPI0006F1FC0F|nr:DUF1772 domain-containing protein [Leifsonia sp. Leaf264]KQO95798.1 hypothetical protein ASF30_19565 [Leifsonia sp. Leaf264]
MEFPLLEVIGLVLVGLLAGEEFIVRWGVQPALAALDDNATILARVALVRRLRVVVPVIMVPTVLVGIAVLIVGGTGDGFGWRIAGVVALVAFVLFSFLGTVPINIKVIDWDADNPPDDWAAVIKRWEVIDVFRSSAAVIAFACFVVALAVQV